MPLFRRLRNRPRSPSAVACQCFALGCMVLISFRGHPPAYAQTEQPIRVIALTAADQKRDDHIETLQENVANNRVSIRQQWDAINSMSRDIATLNTSVKQMQTSLDASHNSSSWLNEASITGILASIGLQIRNSRRRRKGDGSEPEEG